MLVAILSYSPVPPFLICWHAGSFWEELVVDPASLLFSEHASDENEQWASLRMAAWVHLLVENCHRAVLAGGDWSNDAGSRSFQAGAWHDQQCWTALLARCPGPDGMPRKRENPKGEKAKHTRNKCEQKGPAKAPLCGLVAVDLCLWSKGSWGHLGLRKSSPPLALSSPAVPNHVIQVPACPWRWRIGLGQGAASDIWTGNHPCTPEKGLHHNSAHEQVPCCSGTFPGGLAHCSPQASCRFFAELWALWQDADTESGKGWWKGLRGPSNPAWPHDDGAALSLLGKASPAAYFYCFYWVSTVWRCKISVPPFLPPKHEFIVSGCDEGVGFGCWNSRERRKHCTLSFQLFIITWLSGFSLGESSLPSANCMWKLITLNHILDPGTY